MKETESYNDILKNLLEERISNNPQYSLRAFAKDLNIRPSQLSEILNFKKGISEAKAEDICYRLNLSQSEREYFCDLVTLKHSRSNEKKENARIRVTKRFYENDLTLINDDTFKIISDWYHYAIMELIITKDFKTDCKWMAQKLGITVFQVKEAIERLHRMELIAIENGEIKSTGIELETTSGIPSQSIRKFHRQILEKAQIAITQQTVKERHASSLVIACDEEDVEEIGNMLDKFKRKCAQKINNNNKTKIPKHVYGLSMVFCRLTNRETI